ncbi:hypothetical protein B9Z55_029052 [Caenorhabditis nigoni]|nr:hypothetical protein B9Z55_029052 [Caenorhabditis nigoni]
MNESSEVIKNNDRAMKTVILYEALKKNPIFNSYRNFCKLVGQNAMEYKDFEFWYYRFYHGKMDFDYDRSMDPVPKTIMDMPVSLMYKITENLDTVERTYLRTMNKPLKDIADSHPLIFDNIEIDVSNHSLEWTLDYKYFCCAKKDDGYTLQTPTKKIEIDDSFMKKGLEHTAHTVAEALGAEIPFGPLDTIKHCFQIPETNEQLEFKIENAEYSCFIHVRKLR